MRPSSGRYKPACSLCPLSFDIRSNFDWAKIWKSDSGDAGTFEHVTLLIDMARVLGTSWGDRFRRGVQKPK